MAQVVSDALRVEVGYGSTPLTALSSVSWTDVTSSVRLSEGVQFSRGRFGNDATPRPGTLSFTLDNSAQAGTAGRFTSGGTQINLRVPVRVRARYPFITNLVSNPSFETDTTGWGAVGTPTPTFARSTTRASQGSASGLVTWGAGSAGSQAVLISCNTVKGAVYTFSMDVYVPAGNPAVYAQAFFVQASANSSTTGAWQRLSVTFTATSSTTSVGVGLGAAATAGQTCYIDGCQLEEGAAASSYQTTTTSDRQSLWVGYVESVQAGWDGGYRPVLRVTATDRLGRLERRKLPSLIRGQQLVDGAVAVWPLTDAAGAVTAGQQAGSDAGDLTKRQEGSGGTLLFGTGGLAPGPDGLSCAIFTPAAATAGGYNDGIYLRTLEPGSSWQAATSAASAELFFYYTGSSAASCILSLDGNTTLTVRVDSSGNINQLFATTATVGPAVAVDQWHHVAVTQSLSGTTVTTKAYLDGVQFASDTATVPAGANVKAVYVGGGDGTVFNGRMSHVALYPSVLSAATVADHAVTRYTLADYDAQNADDIYTRMCKIAGLPATEYQVDGTTVAVMSPVPVAESGLLEAVTHAATAEAGVVYLNRSGVLTLAARELRRNPTSKFSIPAKCVDRGTSFSTDMSFMVNDVTVARPAGATTRYVNATSTAAYDTHDANITAYLSTDTQAQELASRLARVNATPEPRVSDIKVDLVTGAADLDEGAIMVSDVGDYFQVTSMPTGSPSTTLHLFVEGVTHDVNDSAWQVTMTTTPCSDGFFRNTWVLGDATLSKLGSTTVLGF